MEDIIEVGDKIVIISSDDYPSESFTGIKVVKEVYGGNNIGVWSDDEDNYCWYFSEAEYKLVEKGNKMFSKKDLKTGDILVFKDGEYSQVFLNTEGGDVVSGEKMWFPLNSYTEDNLFKDKESYFIVTQVWRPRYNSSFHISNIDINRESNYKLLWERKEKSQEEIELEALKRKIAELSEQAEKLESVIRK